MKTIIIGKDTRVNALALGAGKMGEDGTDAARFRIMDKFVELGGNCFDTARLYAGGKSDGALGRWLKASGLRDKVVICAKGSHPSRSAMHISRLSEEEILGDLDTSLSEMGQEWVDMYLLHRDDPRLPVAGIVDALNKAVRAGKVKTIGVSNWTVGRIAEANEYARANGLAELSVCQLHTSLAMTSAAQTQDVTHVPMNPYEEAWYKETQFPIMGFGTQGRGFFASHANGLEQKPGSIQSYGYYPENFRRADRAAALAKELGVGLGAVLTAYVRDCGLNAVPLVSVSSIDQLLEVWRANDIALTESQVRWLETGAAPLCSGEPV
ncbi:MAG: aldo/keto reductase [Oscillospiraceae bacterium]|jgi:aryl-alcohol dehydrogenase-like predicted oxidoreductase|nr:aldo/keto reductase [Oscillospiraceae bacterium]